MSLRSNPAPFASVSIHLDGAQPTVSVRHDTAVVTLNSGLAATTLVATDSSSLLAMAKALSDAARLLDSPGANR